MIDLKTQPNEARCHKMRVTHTLSIPPCCPVSKNPLEGSEIEIAYTPREVILEVEALRVYIDSYQGGRGDVRSMEGMIQQICQDCANLLDTPVHCIARLNLCRDQHCPPRRDFEGSSETKRITI